MDLNGVREALRRQPFRPFTIRLADGRSLYISHPEFVAVGQRLIVVTGEEDAFTVVEPLLIVSVDFESTASSETGQQSGDDVG